MTKYIVKNCPAFISKLFNWQQEEDNECLCTFSPEDVNSEMKKCQDCTDCPIKQVVELVEAENKVHRKRQRLIPMLNEAILQTLQVEEVE